VKGERGLALAAFLTVCLVWGTTYLAIRVAIETIPPLALTAIRFVIAGLIMGGIALLRGEKMPRDRSTLLNLAVIGLLMVGIGNLAVVWAEHWVPSGMAALFVATAPFWMVIIELFRKHGERPTVQSALGMFLGFAGVALLVTPGGAGPSWNAGFVAGAIAIQIGSIAWQLGSVRSKYHIKHVPLLSSAALQMLFGGIVVGIVSIAIGEPARFALNPRTLAALAYLTIFGSVIAYSAYIYALAHMRTSRSSLYAYINPVVAVILGWLILDERLTTLSIVATIVILGGVALVQTAKGRPVTAAAVTRHPAMPPDTPRDSSLSAARASRS
jgi:drug/metabolite transporter (DMT)-like permease